MGTTITSNSSMLKVDSLNSDTQDIQCPLSPMLPRSSERVKREIANRIEQIEEIVSFFIDSMIESAASIPFAIRWICKSIVSRIGQQFPGQSPMERDAVIGRLVFSRFIEPILLKRGNGAESRSEDVDHDGVATNLRMISGVLRCILCNESTDSMNSKLSEWIERQRVETAPLFFAKLLDLEDSAFADRLAVDRHLVDCKGDLELSYKQIYVLHHAVYTNAEVWNTDNGNQHLPLLDVMDRLEGDAPFEYVNEEEVAEKVMRIDLALVDADTFNPFFADNDSEDGNSTTSLDAHRLLHEDESYILEALQCLKVCDDEMVVIRDKLKQLLLHQMYPEHIVQDHRHSLVALLRALKEWASAQHNDDGDNKDEVSNLVDSVVEQMTKYQAAHEMLVNDGDDDDAFDVFVGDSHREMSAVERFSQRLQSKAMLFAKARDAIVDHTDYLQNELVQREQLFEAEKANLKRKKHSKKAIKMPFKKLVSQGVIIEDGRDGLDGATFHFVPKSADSFLVEIKLKSRVRSKEFALCGEEPFSLSLMAVLEIRDANRMQFELGSFTFFVDGTLDLLNGLLLNKV